MYCIVDFFMSACKYSPVFVLRLMISFRDLLEEGLLAGLSVSEDRDAHTVFVSWHPLMASLFAERLIRFIECPLLDHFSLNLREDLRAIQPSLHHS